jgi:hypothetical protein
VFAEPSRRDAYFDLHSEDVVLHGYHGVEPGLGSVKRYYAGIWAVFPDARVNAEEMIEINDRVVLRFIMTDTHRALFRSECNRQAQKPKTDNPEWLLPAAAIRN